MVEGRDEEPVLALLLDHRGGDPRHEVERVVPGGRLHLAVAPDHGRGEPLLLGVARRRVGHLGHPGAADRAQASRPGFIPWCGWTTFGEQLGEETGSRKRLGFMPGGSDNLRWATEKRDRSIRISTDQTIVGISSPSLHGAGERIPRCIRSFSSCPPRPYPGCLWRGADQVDRRSLSRVSLPLVLGVSRRRPILEGCSRRAHQRGDEHRQECQRGAGHDRRRDYAPAHPSLVGLVAYGSGLPSAPAPGHARHRRHSTSIKAPL